MMHVLLTYDSGFPTRLEKHPQLAEMIRARGEPTGIRRVWGAFHLAWGPLYPGLPEDGGVVVRMSDPWPGDRRELVRVSVES